MIISFRDEELKAALGRLHDRLVAIGGIGDDAKDLMESWERIIEEDNREGVLAGLDKDGNPAPPLKYRPIGPPKKLTLAQRLGQRPNKRRGEYMGKGPAASGLNNNLSTSEYRRLDGPRLAPRRQFSRVITNLVTGHGRDPANRNLWFAEGAWLDIVNFHGRKFLSFHFDGLVRNTPTYDLRGIRQDGRRKLLEAFRQWAALEIRERYRG